MFKREKDATAHFVREIQIVPEVSVLVATSQQLLDVVRFCTNALNSSIMGVDPTFNMRKFYVTMTTYRNLMFVTKEGVNPVMIGPCLIHTGKTISSYQQLALAIVKFQKELEKCFSKQLSSTL